MYYYYYCYHCIKKLRCVEILMLSDSKEQNLTFDISVENSCLVGPHASTGHPSMVQMNQLCSKLPFLNTSSVCSYSAGH